MCVHKTEQLFVLHATGILEVLHQSTQVPGDGCARTRDDAGHLSLARFIRDEHVLADDFSAHVVDVVVLLFDLIVLVERHLLHTRRLYDGALLWYEGAIRHLPGFAHCWCWRCRGCGRKQGLGSSVVREK